MRTLWADINNIIDVYITINTTNHLTISSGSDLTIYAAINTPALPNNVIAIDAVLSYAPFFTNWADPAGIRKAQEPIIIGKAARGFIPSA